MKKWSPSDLQKEHEQSHETAQWIILTHGFERSKNHSVERGWTWRTLLGHVKGKHRDGMPAAHWAPEPGVDRGASGTPSAALNLREVLGFGLLAPTTARAMHTLDRVPLGVEKARDRRQPSASE